MSYRIAGADPTDCDQTKIDLNSQFANCVLGLFSQIRPTRLVETGTYLGTGTTAIVALALRQCGIFNAQFFSIEVNPRHHAIALHNLAQMGLSATLLLGLSVPRSLLPTREQISSAVLEHQVDGIYVDHQPAARVDLYMSETDFPDLEDDLLGKCLLHFNYQPDFLLLDSAGHMGHIEFQYVLPLIKRRCFFALDDTNHVKHFRSLAQMKADPRFRILAESKEKFGFCFAEFNP